MAKSARASVTKRNHAKLRSTVFGPAADARTARLSAKLQELASLPTPSQKGEESKMDVESEEQSAETTNNTESIATGSEGMDVDNNGKAISNTASKKKKATKTEMKKIRRKAKNSITFNKPHQKNRISKRK